MPVEKLQPITNLDEERFDALKRLFPEAVADGNINFETLKDLLAERIEDDALDAEHFGLFWPGKRAARRLAAQPSKGTLAPVPGEGVDEENTENIFIEGDNLEVLKLLQKSYAGKIKMIYIDPPYNTGNDFIYKDDFKEPLESYLRRTSQADEEGQLLTSNSKADGRFHSNWLNMMYPRLRLARNLLRDDGVIFISIDDNEAHNLRQMMNEIFGEENFIASFIWQKMDSPSRNDPERYVSEYHEYLIAFGKSKDVVGLKKKAKSQILDGYTLQLSDGRMARRRQLRKNGKGARREDRPTMFFPLTAPDETKVLPIAPDGWEGRWVLSEETWEERTKQGLTQWIKRERGWVPYYLEVAPAEPAVPWPTLWTEVDQNRQAVAKFTELMGSNINFANPKPVDLLQQILRLATSPDDEDLILDFFAGSGSTAHAVLEHNKLDGGNRKFILVQIPEAVANPSYPTIAEITKARLRRAFERLTLQLGNELELSEDSSPAGFRVFKLTASNFQRWRNYEEQQVGGLLLQMEKQQQTPLAAGYKEADVLTELALQEGIALPARQIEVTDFTRNKVFCLTDNFNAHRLFICLDPELWDETVEQIAQLPEEDVFYCFDSALSDAAKIQLAECCRIVTI